MDDLLDDLIMAAAPPVSQRATWSPVLVRIIDESQMRAPVKRRQARRQFCVILLVVLIAAGIAVGFTQRAHVLPAERSDVNTSHHTHGADNVLVKVRDQRAVTSLDGDREGANHAAARSRREL